MIKLYLLSNFCYEKISEVTLQDLLSYESIQDGIFNKFDEEGIVTKQNYGILYVNDGENLIPLDESILTSDAVIVYSTIVKPDSAYEFGRENGITYFFHTKEKGHFF